MRHHADPYLPGHGDWSWSASHYDLDLDYRVETNRLAGRAKIAGVAAVEADRIHLDLDDRLTVGKLTLDGSSVKYQHRRNKVEIRPRRPIRAGVEFELAIGYRGSPAPLAGPDGDAGWEELTDGVIVAAQPHGAPSWFPCNDRPSDKASYRFTVTADAAYRVIANGPLTKRYRHASRVTWTFRQRQPMASYLATLQIGRYTVQELPAFTMYAPSSLRAETTRAFADQQAMISFFSEVFGEYPYDEYAVVVTDDELEIPVEAQGLSIFGRNHADTGWDAQRLIAHELAHQWFGNCLTVRRWSDIWLNEGFACYAEWLWSQKSGRESVDARARDHWTRLRDLPQDLVVADPGPDLMFDDRVYKRGALALHAVRKVVGDDAFFALVRRWVAEHRHGLVTTEAFVELVTAEHPQAKDPLHRWLFQPTVPALP